MAESKKAADAGGRNLTDKQDPTLRSEGLAPEYPEGTHPARGADEVTHSVDKLEYREVKPPSPFAHAVEQVLDGTEAGSFGYSDKDDR